MEVGERKDYINDTVLYSAVCDAVYYIYVVVIAQALGIVGSFLNLLQY